MIVEKSPGDLCLRRQRFRRRYYGLMKWASGRKRRKGVYYERHHVIPKSLGGTENKKNLVYLTAVQHYQAHKLLVGFLTGRKRLKMICALKRFTGDTRRDRRISESEYRRVKIAHAEAVSILQRGKVAGEESRKKMSASQKARYQANPTHWRGRSHTSKTRKKMSKAQGGTRNGFYGRSHTKSVRKRISNTLKGVKKSPETVAKFRLRRDSEEVRRKKSEAIKEWWTKKKSEGGRS